MLKKTPRNTNDMLDRLKNPKRSVNINLDSALPWIIVLTILFVTLKLTGHVDWSWIWVLAPIWIPLCFVLAILLLFLSVACCVGILIAFLEMK